MNVWNNIKRLPALVALEQFTQTAARIPLAGFSRRSPGNASDGWDYYGDAECAVFSGGTENHIDDGVVDRRLLLAGGRDWVLVSKRAANRGAPAFHTTIGGTIGRLQCKCTGIVKLVYIPTMFVA